MLHQNIQILPIKMLQIAQVMDNVMVNEGSCDGLKLQAL